MSKLDKLIEKQRNGGNRFIRVFLLVIKLISLKISIKKVEKRGQIK